MKTRSFVGLIIVAAMVAVWSCGGGKTSPAVAPSSVVLGTFTDERDGQTYRTVIMPDGKTWMAENLNYDTADGNGSWCYDNNKKNCAKYGRLYDWNTAMMACPAGWHLPSDEEWGALMVAINPSCSPTEHCAGVGTKLRANTGWTKNPEFEDDVIVGTDDYGFSALPGGRRWGSLFEDVGLGSSWWTATEYNTSSARLRGVFYHDEYVHSYWLNKPDLFAVRCIRDD